VCFELEDDWRSLVREQAKVTRPSAGARRAAEAELDGVSSQLGEVLRQADELLAEWQRFGVQVRAEVDREVASIGGAVGGAIDGAVDRAADRASSAVDAAVARTLERSVQDRLGALATELGRLEQRAKAAARVVAEDRERDRWMLWTVIGGVVVANVLLALVLLRDPVSPTVAPAPVPTPVPIQEQQGATDDDETPSAVEPAPVESGSAATPTSPTPVGTEAGSAVGAGSGSGSAVVKPLPKPKTRRVPARRAPPVEGK
jgi:hypothetical protein